MTAEEKALAIIRRANERLRPLTTGPLFNEKVFMAPNMHCLIAAVADELLDLEEKCREDYSRLNDRILALEIRGGL